MRSLSPDISRSAWSTDDRVASSSSAAIDNQIINLNVGGQRFSTSKSTLLWIPDTFFTSLLSRRISSVEDDNGAIFIDRDPELFRRILNFLRTKHIDLDNVSIPTLRHEAEFYGIRPLVKRLSLCEEMSSSPCGDVLFYAYIPVASPAAPSPPTRSLERDSSRRAQPVTTTGSFGVGSAGQAFGHGRAIDAESWRFSTPAGSFSVFSTSTPSSASAFDVGYHRQRRYDASGGNAYDDGGIEATPMRFIDAPLPSPMAAVDCNGQPSFDGGVEQRVRIIRAHHNSVAVAYYNYVCCYRMKETLGWQMIYVSPRMSHSIRHIALVSRFGGGATGAAAEKMLAIALANNTVHLLCLDDGSGGGGVTDVESNRKIGTFSLSVEINKLFFIGNQLVALSKAGKVGIWNAMTMNWQVQDVMQISCFDTAGSVLLLGCTNGSIYYFDMQKFPLRLKDNDLLITELYRDPNGDVITAVSVYLTPKTNLCGNWIEIAYGTNTGIVRVIVQHPETVGHGPQLFQTFTVHTAPITRIALTMNHLISVCGEYNHVRTWNMVRFRGMISTQPGGTSLASFKVLTLDVASTTDDYCGESLAAEGCDSGPYGDQDGEQVFVQRVLPDTTVVFVRLASTGDRLCTIRSVDGSPITAFFVHECEGSNRMGARQRRFLFSGTANGSVQMWDLTTALDAYQRGSAAGHFSASGSSSSSSTTLADKSSGAGGGSAQSMAANASLSAGAVALQRQLLGISQGPSPDELMQLIDECELHGGRLASTPSPTPRSLALNLSAYVAAASNESRHCTYAKPNANR